MRTRLRVPDEQAAEIDRRLATLDADIAEGQDAYEVLAEFRSRYR